jgi:hypothetical protein
MKLNNIINNNLASELLVYIIFFIFLIFILNISIYEDNPKKNIKEKKPKEVPQKASWFQRL